MRIATGRNNLLVFVFIIDNNNGGSSKAETLGGAFDLRTTRHGFRFFDFSVLSLLKCHLEIQWA